MKECPRCGTEHTKRGPYCSRSCGNVRTHSQEDKLKRSLKLTEYYRTPEGLATAKMNKYAIENLNRRRAGEYMLKPEDFAINIPSLEDDEEEKINW
jgi:hypothetical protein